MTAATKPKPPAATPLTAAIPPAQVLSRLAALQTLVASVNVVENVCGLEVATAQAALGGICRVSLVCGGLSISPMASTPM
jgi:hypothetical protein